MIDSIKNTHNNLIFKHFGLIVQLRHAGKTLRIHHIYREFNREADALANRGADGENDQMNWL